MSAFNLATPPVYRKVKKWIQDMIETGKWQPDDRIPSVQELAELLGVGRSSVREALLVLEQEGLIVRRHGVGTFVCKPAKKVSFGLETMQNLTKMLESQGKNVCAKDTVVVYEAAEQDIAEKLDISIGDPIVVIERTYMLDDHPVAVCVSSVPVKIIGTNVDIPSNQSLFSYLEHVRGHKVNNAFCRVIASKAGEFVASKLQMAKGQCEIILEQIIYDDAGNIIMFTRDHFNPAKVDFYIFRS